MEYAIKENSAKQNTVYKLVRIRQPKVQRECKDWKLLEFTLIYYSIDYVTMPELLLNFIIKKYNNSNFYLQKML